MKKQSKRRIIIGVAILLVLLILGIVLINNVINSKNFSQQQYFSTTQDAGSNLVAKYIKKGITIGGITGTLEVTQTEDATASSMNIDYGETAYINGQKVEKIQME